MATGISFSLGVGSKSQVPAKPSPRPTNGTKRPHAALYDDSDDEDGVAKESITHFDKSGGFDVQKPKVVKQPLVIQRQANRDWKDASKEKKRQKYGIPGHEGNRAADLELAVKKEAQVMYGLDVRKRAPVDNEELEATAENAGLAQVPGHDNVSQEGVPAKSKTDEERAIDALMGVRPDSHLVLPAVDEEEAFQRDYTNAPDMATLEQYAAVPVEEFGAALLRGMGWKEGQGIGNQRGKKIEKVKVPERRPALLGIGAKADAAVAGELGAWGQGAKGKRRPDIVYNPLTLRNKTTGEQLTEEELKVKLEKQKDRDANGKYEQSPDRDLERHDKSVRRHRHDDYDSEQYEREKRERRRERDSKDKHRPSRQDRSNSHDRKRDGRREKYYDDAPKERRKVHDDDESRKERRKDRDNHGRSADRDGYERTHSKRDRYEDDRDRDSRRHRR